jgi:hypothetical protein
MLDESRRGSAPLRQVTGAKTHLPGNATGAMRLSTSAIWLQSDRVSRQAVRESHSDHAWTRSLLQLSRA